MKGEKQRFKETHIDNANTFQHKSHRDRGLMLAFTYLDLVPLEFTRENVMKWLAESGWIEGLVIKYLGDQFPYLDDYIQEIYLLIFDKIDKLIEVYETRGILAFCGYVKMIVFTNCFAEGSAVYKKVRYFNRNFTVSCDTEVWNTICDTYDPDTMQYYKFSKTTELL